METFVCFRTFRSACFLGKCTVPHCQICKHVLGFVGLTTICLYLDTNYNASFNQLFVVVVVFLYNCFIINVNFLFYFSTAIMLFDVI